MTEDTASSSQSVEISGHSAKIEQLKKIVEKVSATDVNVLITGESGTGKEIVGRLIHSLSNRKNKPFVPVNCGAIPTDLLESELFGHEKGAFTGAITSRMGRFELASGGTLFLDEIGDMPLAMQVKILRALQEKVIERVGSNKSIKVDVRIIAATHRNLEDEIGKGTFREDLFYRLNVFPIEMPSLRERLDDIPYLINDLVDKFKESTQVDIKLTNQAIESLKQCKWNGNIRELSNLIERLIVMYPNQTVDVEQLPEKYQNQSPQSDSLALKNLEMTQTVIVNQSSEHQGLNLRDMLHHIELKYIKEALDKTGGIVSHAAEHLGMRRTTLIEKMKKFNIVK
ncbi:MAG: sigma-54-dependent Fis family transcriptional regulator [Proteobacteria bacterium]|nr:sigma-54-dependent Fis family transcriptional regulator [Pseudomonadota bacterium]